MKQRRVAPKYTTSQRSGLWARLVKNYQRNLGSYLLASKPLEKLMTMVESNSKEIGDSTSNGKPVVGRMNPFGPESNVTQSSSKTKRAYESLTTKQVKSSGTS